MKPCRPAPLHPSLITWCPAKGAPDIASHRRALLAPQTVYRRQQQYCAKKRQYWCSRSGREGGGAHARQRTRAVVAAGIRAAGAHCSACAAGRSRRRSCQQSKPQEGQGCASGMGARCSLDVVRLVAAVRCLFVQLHMVASRPRSQQGCTAQRLGVALAGSIEWRGARARQVAVAAAPQPGMMGAGAEASAYNAAGRSLAASCAEVPTPRDSLQAQHHIVHARPLRGVVRPARLAGVSPARGCGRSAVGAMRAQRRGRPLDGTTSAEGSLHAARSSGHALPVCACAPQRTRACVCAAPL